MNPMEQREETWYFLMTLGHPQMFKQMTADGSDGLVTELEFGAQLRLPSLLASSPLNHWKVFLFLKASKEEKLFFIQSIQERLEDRKLITI